MANALERRFQIAQSQLKKQESARQMQEDRAMRRQFAQAGALGSGAAIKSSMESRARGAERLQSGMLALKAEKLGQQYQEEQAQKQRGFLTGEREASQLFSSGEAQKQRGFLTGEREAGQLFSSGEAQKQRGFLTGEREAGQLFSSGEAQKQRGFLTGEREASQKYATGERKAGQEYATGERKASQLFSSGERIAGQQFATSEAEKSRQADWKRFTASLDFEKAQAEIANTLAQSEFDINKFVTLENINMARRSLGLDPLGGFSRDKKPSITSDGSRQGSVISSLTRDELKAIASGKVSAWNRQTNRRLVNVGGKQVEISDDEYRDIVNYYRQSIS
jgi:hypothetical protein